METIQDRVILFLDFIALKNPALESKTGVKSSIWASLRNRRIRVNEDHLEGLKTLGQEYLWWVITGDTIPEIGFIKPGDPKTKPQRTEQDKLQGLEPFANDLIKMAEHIRLMGRLPSIEIKETDERQ